MRTIIVFCSLLGALIGCSGVQTYIGQDSQQSANSGKRLLDRQRYDEAVAAFREA